ncbi:hypothetical protein CRU92_08855 [Arcobacter sp. FW59]|nr:hypothetical protein CRU92_08855 [Arcobacter sp. FW59]
MKKISLISSFIALALANSFANAEDSSTTILDEVKVTSKKEKKEVGTASSIGTDTIERRNTNNIADLLNQTSGISLNGLYQRPDISVEIQGLGGHGRVSQSLEGIQQNFEAFGHNFKQSGTILVNPAFLKSIDIKKGATADASSIGNLAGSANFQYFDVNDIVQNGKNYGGLLKFSTGISKYSNGQEPSGSAIVGAKGDKWGFLVGLSKSENKNYRMGKNISTSKYVKNSDFSNWGGGSIYEEYLKDDGSIGNKTYGYDFGGGDIIHKNEIYSNGSMASPEILAKGDSYIINTLKDVNKNNPFPGTFRKTESGMAKFRYFIDDEQTINLFATKTKAHYQSDVSMTIRKNLDGTSEFLEPAFYVDTKLDSDIISSNYQASFSEFFNPSFTLFYERMKRDQFWPNPYGSELEVVDKFYSKIEDNSIGLRVDNTSYFSDTYLGSIKFNIGMEYKKLNHKANDYTATHAHNQYVAPEHVDDISDGVSFNPDSDSDTYAASMALSSDYKDDNPWKWNISTGVKRVFLNVNNPSIIKGNIVKSGLQLNYKYFMPEDLTIEEQSAWRRGNGDQASYQAWQEHRQSFYGKSQAEYSREDKKHSWTLKATNADLQYTIPNTNLTIYTQGSYGQRAPSSTELYMNGAYYKGYMRDARYLKIEKNLSLQTGLNYQKSDLFSNDDFISLNANLYRNKVKNHIQMAYPNLESTSSDYSAYEGIISQFGYSGYVNNTEDWITKGLGIDFSYSQDSFYINGNMTVPFKKKNKVCYDEFPGGNGYYHTTDTQGNTTITSVGNGKNVCGNSYKWATIQTIEPFQASLTAAITPLNGDLELGTTLHYRGKQKSYLYIKDSNWDTTGNSPYKVGDMAEVKRFPDVLKFDIFANYKVTKALKVGVYVANITDQLDMMPFSEYATVLPGRTITASLEYRF